MVKTNRSTLHMLYNIQVCHAGQRLYTCGYSAYAATQDSNHDTTVTQDSHNIQVCLKIVSAYPQKWLEARHGASLAWCPRRDCLAGWNLESFGATHSAQWAQNSSFSSAWCSNAEKWGLSWIKQHTFAIFTYIFASKAAQSTSQICS